MKNLKKLIKLIAAVLIGAMGVSCSTSYDSYGNRRQSVSPGGVAVGAVALGVLAYSIGKNKGKQKEHRRHTRGYDDHRSSHSGHGGYRNQGYDRGNYGNDYCR
jgi:hypothetical protein